MYRFILTALALIIEAERRDSPGNPFYDSNGVADEESTFTTEQLDDVEINEVSENKALEKFRKTAKDVMAQQKVINELYDRNMTTARRNLLTEGTEGILEEHYPSRAAAIKVRRAYKALSAKIKKQKEEKAKAKKMTQNPDSDKKTRL